MSVFLCYLLSIAVSAKENKQPEDAALVAAAQDGDFDAFATLVARHEQRLYALAMRIVRQRQDAEDVVQSTLVSALEGLGKFRGEAAFGTWVRRIATNKALNLLRKRRGLPVVPNDCPDGTDDCLPKPEYLADWRSDLASTVEQRELRRLLDEGLDDLPESQRIVFVLRDVEGLSTREAARTLEISEANVKVRLMRARLKLREYLTHRLGDPSRAVPADPAAITGDHES